MKYTGVVIATQTPIYAWDQSTIQIIGSQGMRRKTVPSVGKVEAIIFWYFQ